MDGFGEVIPVFQCVVSNLLAGVLNHKSLVIWSQYVSLERSWAATLKACSFKYDAGNAIRNFPTTVQSAGW